MEISGPCGGKDWVHFFTEDTKSLEKKQSDFIGPVRKYKKLLVKSGKSRSLVTPFLWGKTTHLIFL
jgi:hypothetical protein